MQNTPPATAAYGAAGAGADRDLALAKLPFSNIMRSEQAHQAWLTELLQRYDVPIPDKAEARAHVELPASLTEAFQAGVEANGWLQARRTTCRLSSGAPGEAKRPKEKETSCVRRLAS